MCVHWFSFAWPWLIFYPQSAPERTQKDTTKASATQKVSNGVNAAGDETGGSGASKVNPEEVTNEYAKMNGYAKALGSKQDTGRQRAKRDEKSNAEFFNQIAVTMQNLQRDLDRITARVRSLEGQALQALAPQTVSVIHVSIHFYSIEFVIRSLNYTLFPEATYNFVPEMVAFTRMLTAVVRCNNTLAFCSAIFDIYHATLPPTKTVIQLLLLSRSNRIPLLYC